MVVPYLMFICAREHESAPEGREFWYWSVTVSDNAAKDPKWVEAFIDHARCDVCGEPPTNTPAIQWQEIPTEVD